ncbi:hypothetical protein EBR03_10560, partial [bacterium]|nr:hypothetical protein [bacterium]
MKKKETTEPADDFQEKMDELVLHAKEQGFITYEEINERLPMSFDSPEQIDQVLIFLSGMDVQVLNQAEVERQKEKKKEAKELEGIVRKAEGTPDDPVRMYLKEMGSVPLLTREEEVEISKRIEKAQWQVERIIMRFRYSAREAISIIASITAGKDRFDKVIAEKEIEDKPAYLELLPRLAELLKNEDQQLESYLIALRNPKIKKDEIHAKNQKFINDNINSGDFNNNEKKIALILTDFDHNLQCFDEIVVKINDNYPLKFLLNRPRNRLQQSHHKTIDIFQLFVHLDKQQA